MSHCNLHVGHDSRPPIVPQGIIARSSVDRHAPLTWQRTVVLSLATAPAFAVGNTSTWHVLLLPPTSCPALTGLLLLSSISLRALSICLPPRKNQNPIHHHSPREEYTDSRLGRVESSRIPSAERFSRLDWSLLSKKHPVLLFRSTSLHTSYRLSARGRQARTEKPTSGASRQKTPLQSLPLPPPHHRQTRGVPHALQEKHLRRRESTKQKNGQGPSRRRRRSLCVS